MDNINEFTIKSARAERFLRFVKIEVGQNDLIHPGQVGAIFARDITLNTDNGIGKTTWMRIQYYTIYGKDIYGVKADDLSNDDINGGHFTEVIFSSKGNDYLVQRFCDWVPYTGGPVMENSEKKNRQSGVRFYLVKGHDLLPLRGGTDKETQKMIDDIVGFSADTAKTIFMTAQGEKSPLLEATAAKTQEVLMELFPLEFVDQSHDKVKKLADEQSKVVTEIKQAKERLDENLSAKESDVAKYEELSHKFAQNIAVQIDELRQKFREQKEKKEKLDAQILNSGINEETRAEYKTLNEDLVALGNNPRLMELPDLYRTKQDEYREANKQLNTIKDESRTLETDVKVMESELVLANKSKVASDLDEVRKMIKENPEKIRAAELRRNEIDKLISENNLSLAEINTIKKQIEGHSDSLKVLIAKRPDVDRLETEDVDSLRKQLAEIEAKNQLAKSELSDLEKSLKETQASLSVLGIAETEDLAVAESSIELKQKRDSVLENLNSKKHDLGLKKAMLTLQQGEVDKLAKKPEGDVESCPYCDRPYGEHEHTNQQQAKEKAEKAVSDLQVLKVEIESLNSEMDNLKLSYEEIDKKYLFTERVEKALVLKGQVTKISAKIVSLKVDPKIEEDLKKRIAISVDVTTFNDLSHKIDLANKALKSLKYDENLSSKLMIERQELSSVRSMESLESEEKDLSAKLDVLVQKEKTLSELKDKQLSVLKLLNTKTEELQKITDDGKLLSAELKELETQKAEKTAKIQVRLADLKPKIEAVETLEEESRSAHREMLSLDAQGKAKKAEKDPYAELITQSNDKIEEIKARIKDTEDRLLKAELEMEMYNFWLEGFGRKGIKAFVYDDTIKVLNSRIHTKMSKFGFDGVMSVEFVPEVTLANGSVKNEIRKVFKLNGREKPWHSFSGGQKARFIFATNLAIREVAEERCGVRFNNPFFDEPFDGLCSTSQQIAMRLLMDVAKDHTGVKIITHDTGLQALCTRVLYLLKKGNFSYKVSKETFENPMTFSPTPPDRIEEKVRKKKAATQVESNHNEEDVAG
ncbi:SMC family ATPase [Bdellovibrio sp. BCCA]|uniref:SMC family ATPase n=1 Tax=Bdellovibrio sp. BCCA TaxID=3136281 RepID=UPI0030F2CE71